MRIHFIGIGGAGTAPLAKIMLERGHLVSGSDREAGPKTEQLRALGAAVAIGHDAKHLPDGVELVVFSSAVGADNPELAKARACGVRTVRRGEFLGELADSFQRLIAVSGSHGKTSVTAMIAWVLARHFPGAGWLIGGEVPDFPMARAGAGDVFVTEVDESDGTHTSVHPWCGVVPNIDDDHSWSVGGEAQLMANFTRFGLNSRHLIYAAGERADGLFGGWAAAERTELEADGLPEQLIGFQRLNAALARQACRKLGLGDAAIHAALADFPGVDRRLSWHYRSAELGIIEDYAHHPTEIAHSIATLRRMLEPGMELVVVFQPHRFARLEKYFDRMAEELAKADQVVIVPVFAAWSDTGRVDGADLARAIGAKARYLSGSWATIAAELLAAPRRAPMLLAIMGAGDLNRLFDYLPR